MGGVTQRLPRIQKSLKFNETTHIYKLGDLIIPSVSEIIKPLSNQVYGEIDEYFLKNAAERGTDVHFDIEQYLKTGWKPSLTEETEGYFNAFLDAYENNLKKLDVKTFASELRIYSPTYLYAGTLDLILIDSKNNATIIDFKTTAEKHEKLWSVQLTGYKQIIAEAGINVNEMFVLQLKRDGTYELVELNDETGLFMACYLINQFE